VVPYARLAQWESGSLTNYRRGFDSLTGYCTRVGLNAGSVRAMGLIGMTLVKADNGPLTAEGSNPSNSTLASKEFRKVGHSVEIVFHAGLTSLHAGLKSGLVVNLLP
jgi:hypothetical protein